MIMITNRNNLLVWTAAALAAVVLLKNEVD